MYNKADYGKTETYELSGTLSADGWGELHHARYLPHQRQLLVRILTEKLSAVAGAWELLRGELRAWARVKHSGILQVLDWGKIGERYYFATEMPDGDALETLITWDKGVDYPEHVFINILKSVEAARNWGVLHLGLNLNNIWLSEQGGIQVGEYGLWYVTREYPGIGEENGLFMAPEQRGAGRVSAATDVYSLALVFISLKYGMEVTQEVAGGAALPEDLGDLKPVVTRCLDKQPLARYRSAGELAAELGLNPADWTREEFRDCPICSLRDEIMNKRSQGSDSPAVEQEVRGKLETVIWITVGVMAAVVAVLWLLAVW
ncbi:MAG: protein kinase [Actinobacteria bacterium]|nr:protein kinase [Actinomycetota bacterium]